MKARVSRHGALLFISLFYAFPAFVVIVNSLKTTSQYLLGPLDVPLGNLTLDNYAKAINNPSLNFPSAVGFSVMFASATVVVAVALGGGLSYLLARSRHRLANVIYVVVVAGLIIPPEVSIIPIVKILSFLGLLFNPIGLILVEASVNLSFVVFILVPFIRAVPIELDESAQLDGAGQFTTYWRIIFPLLKPPIVSVAILIFAAAWNDFLNPQILLRPGQAYTVTTGIYRGLGVHSTDWSSVFAYIVLAAAPVMILFFMMQRFVTDGLTRGAVKG